MVKNLPVMQDLIHGSWEIPGKSPWRRKWLPTPVFLAWRIPWREEFGKLQFMELQRVGHNWVTNTFTFHFTLLKANGFVLSLESQFNCTTRHWACLETWEQGSCNDGLLNHHFALPGTHNSLGLVLGWLLPIGKMVMQLPNVSLQLNRIYSDLSQKDPATFCFLFI